MNGSARIPVVAGNWKMNGDEKKSLEIALRVSAGADSMNGVEKVLCPPFVYLHAVADHVRGSTILIGAQNCHWETHGAYTGEVSAAMLRGLVDLVIVGHSERRTYFNETDEIVNKKVKAVLDCGLRPIFCVGETQAERDAGEMASVLKRQLRDGLRGMEIPPDFIIAYEPVWAIGTGVPATGEMANEAIGLIRKELEAIGGHAFAPSARILYGGSVTPENFAEFMNQPEIDGGLVGGASLDPDAFVELVRIGAGKA
ncbi:MAG TPA: triose-phosphate isomerase [Dehalococcoidia bacterium]|nr:triose-phosphate isomerase [Dehalococcoidia bacterium]